MARPPRTFSSADFCCSQSISLREGLRRLQARYDFQQVVSTASRFAESFYIITHALHGHETYGLSLETCIDSITVAMVSRHDGINVSPEELPCLENVEVLASLAKFPLCSEIIVIQRAMISSGSRPCLLHARGMRACFAERPPRASASQLSRFGRAAISVKTAKNPEGDHFSATSLHQRQWKGLAREPTIS
jgi:hypothetical protein